VWFIKGSQDNKTRSDGRVERFHFDKAQALTGTQSRYCKPRSYGTGLCRADSFKSGQR